MHETWSVKFIVATCIQLFCTAISIQYMHTTSESLTLLLTTMSYVIITGACITGVLPNQACSLKGSTTACENFTATRCTCGEGYEVQGLICIGKQGSKNVHACMSIFSINGPAKSIWTCFYGHVGTLAINYYTAQVAQ